MKFWRFKKKWIEAVLAFAMTAVLAGCAWQGTAISEEGGLLTKTQVEEDRKQAIQYVEDVHPFFELEEDQSEYKEAKKAYISQTQSGMTVWEFWGATAEYMSSLRDAHTRIQDPGGIKVLDIPASYENGKSYLWENGKRTGLYVEKVGGVDVEKIYEKIDKMIVAENAAAEEQNREKYLAVNARTADGCEACKFPVKSAGGILTFVHWHFILLTAMRYGFFRDPCKISTTPQGVGRAFRPLSGHTDSRVNCRTAARRHY